VENFITIRRPSLRTVALILLIGAVAAPPPTAVACTTLLVGKKASADGSVLMATSCDSGSMGLVKVVPAQTFEPGTKRKLYFDFPAPASWQEQAALAKRGFTQVGQIEVDRTYRCVLAAGHFADSVTGGINEHGVSMGIEWMGMKKALVSKLGKVSTCSSHSSSSLIANGLMRAKTAREAIGLMGAMVEEYGFTYYWSPSAGCAIPVVDKNEAWIMEIFGPGADWKPESGRPGAVWCAQRVPDGEVTCNANRSRIGRIDLEDRQNFLGSANIHSLARELGLWKPGAPFVWHEVYGVTGSRGNSLREWAALSLVAPSLGLQATGDPAKDRYPFSVKPDQGVDVAKLAAIMRDTYEGTPFDVTQCEEFRTAKGKLNPMARAVGDRRLFDTVGVKPERCIATGTSGYVYISQIRDWLPDSIAGCMWFTLGPSYTSCFAPIYSGVTELPPSWSRSPDFTRVDRSQAQWKFQLVEDLTGLRYQEAIQDVQKVYEPAEAQFLALQPTMEAYAKKLHREQGAAAAQQFVTAYSNQCLRNVDEAYGKLVDHLTFKYLYSYSADSPAQSPKVKTPSIPKPE